MLAKVRDRLARAPSAAAVNQQLLALREPCINIFIFERAFVSEYASDSHDHKPPR